MPVDLCAASDTPSDAADAYMGELSAGHLAQALACIYPDTVDPSTTRSLLLPPNSHSAYLPGPPAKPGIFIYRGYGKTVTVTVTTEPGGKNWVTAVSSVNH